MTNHPRFDVTWRKSSFSGVIDCVEVARGAGEGILLRSSKRPDGQVLCFTRSEFRAFAEAIRSGRDELT